MTIEQWLKDVYYDEWGTCIWSKDEDGGNQMVADIRGWGAIQNLFNTPEEAEQFQDEVGEFIVQAIKEKLSTLPQQETLYTEEQMIGFSEWILNSDSKKVLTRTKESLLKEYIESIKQPKKD